MDKLTTKQIKIQKLHNNTDIESKNKNKKQPDKKTSDKNQKEITSLFKPKVNTPGDKKGHDVQIG